MKTAEEPNCLLVDIRSSENLARAFHGAVQELAPTYGLRPQNVEFDRLPVRDRTYLIGAIELALRKILMADDALIRPRRRARAAKARALP